MGDVKLLTRIPTGLIPRSFHFQIVYIRECQRREWVARTNVSILVRNKLHTISVFKFWGGGGDQEEEEGRRRWVVDEEEL